MRRGRVHPLFRGHAFTLVEVVVVIGIIAMLMAILLPAIRLARLQAMTVKCASNLRQIGQGLYVYANNNRDGYLPGWSGWQVFPDGSHVEDDPGLGWTEQIADALGAPPYSDVHNCPAFPAEMPLNYFLSSHWVQAHTPIRRHLKLSEIRLSSQFVLSGDCTTPGLYPPPFGTAGLTTVDCDKDDATGKALLFPEDNFGINMHPAGNNVLFADGHVQPFKRFEPAAMTYHPTEMRDWADVIAE